MIFRGLSVEGVNGPKLVNFSEFFSEMLNGIVGFKL